MIKFVEKITMVAAVTCFAGTVYAAPTKTPQLGPCELAYMAKKVDNLIDVCQKEADKNSARAMYILGDIYQLGIIAPQNYELSAKYLYKAAELGDSDAQFLYAELIHSHKIKEDSPDAVIKYFTKAAEQGNPRAQYMLGVIYTQGMYGIKADPQRGFEFYKKAADNEDAHFGRAQVEVAKCYSLGIGVKIDEVESVKYLEMAADNKDLMAKYILGITYYQGLGVKRDLNKSRNLLSEAAREGHRGAQQALIDLKFDEETAK